MDSFGARFLRPDRKDEPHRNGSLGRVRQCIESTIWTCKSQLALSATAGAPSSASASASPSDCSRSQQASHNQRLGDPGHHFTT